MVRKIVITVLFFSALFVSLGFFAFPLSAHIALAQTTESTADREARLKAELAQVEEEQRQTEATLQATQAQSASLSRDITILNTKIKAAELNIKAKNLVIEGLGKDIVKKQNTINTLSARIDRGHETLAQVMRKTNEVDTVSLPEIILSGRSLTNIFADLDTFESLQSSLKATFEQIRSDRTETQNQKDELDKRKNAEEDARYVIEQEKNNISANQAEETRLLTISKNNEQTYGQILAEKQKRAAEIRAALFSLRDAVAIPFGDALRYATQASSATGVRPAFLLAILTQESALGANVGSCYLTNTTTGSGASVKTGNAISKVMNPTRDVPTFISITKSLGLDYLKTLVSCPQSVGWGGAMGPAQFIPSTWSLFSDRIAQALGTSLPNPWAPRDAFMASSIYLGDLGAVGGSYTGEQNAACRYYSGKSCSASSLVRSYGTQVMAKADIIQRTMINPLQGI